MAKHRTTVSIDKDVHAIVSGLVDDGVIESVSAFLNDALVDFVAALDLFTFVTDEHEAGGHDPLSTFESLEAYQSSGPQQQLQVAHQAWSSTLAGSSPLSAATKRLLTSYATAVESTSAPESSPKSGEAEVA